MANTRSAELKNKMKKNNTTTQLEVESRRMEERLRMLKEMMSAEKARREVEGGFLWESGQKGPLLRHNKTDQTITTVKTTPVSGGNSGQRKNKEKIRVKILSDKNESDSKISEMIRCGQCDKSTASLSCVECLENYCQLCYAKFHHKGALASHHAKPVSSKSKSHKNSQQKATTSVNTSKLSQSTTSEAVETNRSEQQTHSSKPMSNNNSLLDGTYNEKDSAASFQQALAEWRAQSGKTSSEAQASTTKDSETATVTSAGMQAGETAVGRLKNPHPQIKFSGKSGVTYFEQLMMKRHRYDPMFLSRAKQSSLSDEADVLWKIDDDRDIPIDEGTPSQYNIFYDPELTEPLHNTVDDSTVDDNTAPSALPVTSSDVEIVELSVSQSVTAANPSDVTIKPNVVTEQVKNNSKKAATKVGSTEHPKLVSKKQTRSSRLKSKVRSVHANPAIPHFQPVPRPASVASVVSESDLEASVKKAWTQSVSGHTQLSQFFLQGVEPIEAENEEEKRHVEKNTPFGFCKSKLSSTVWLPGNSTSEALINDDINPATDLPPLMTDKPLLQNKPNIYSNDSQSESGDDDCGINELDLSVSNLEDGDVCERDEEDDKALDDLAWELASTVECEGRLTRCESELDEEDGHFSAPPLSPQPGSGETDEPFPLTDLSQVMSEFELFMNQQTAMEQDSD